MKNLTNFLSSPTALRWVMNLYPPLLGAGIRTRYISPDFRQIDVSMNLNRLNKNIVGAHFGGSLYAMTDPFFMLSLMNILGSEYIVWDQGANIKFVKPGKGMVRAKFEVTQAMLDDIKEKTATGEKYTPTYPVAVIDENNETVATVDKQLYVRKKSKYR